MSILSSRSAWEMNSQNYYWNTDCGIACGKSIFIVDLVFSYILVSLCFARNMPCLFWSRLAWPLKTWACWPHRFVFRAEFKKKKKSCVARQKITTKANSCVLSFWKCCWAAGVLERCALVLSVIIKTGWNLRREKNTNSHTILPCIQSCCANRRGWCLSSSKSPQVASG